MKLLEGKNTLITGGSRGIGKAIVETFADHGANVAFTYRSSAEAAEAVRKEIEAKGVQCVAIQADAADPEAAANLISQVNEAFGSIDIIVNNAGITRDNLLLRMSDEQWQQVMDNNLSSVYYLTKAALKTMLRARKGAFVNISSVVGLTGNAGQANYAASKAGMIGFTKSVAKEVASRNIRANVICPGFIETEMTASIPEEDLKVWLQNVPLNRPGKGEEVANLCAFLGSDMAAYITGQVINVDGGMVMS